MGLPALLVPENIVNKIPELLQKEDIKVEIKELGVQDNNYFNIHYVCSTKDKIKVRLGFGRPSYNPKLLVVVFRYVDSSGFTFRSNKPLLKKIENILRKYGATDLPRPEREK